MTLQIKHRYKGAAVLFECDLPAQIAEKSFAFQLGYAVREACKEGAYLADADLTGADLTGADLTGASLTSADLTSADLTGADLTGADLTGADLAGAYLAGADLTGADLTGADLTGAKNVPKGIIASAPTTPYVRSASRIDLMLRFRERNPDVPVVEDLDQKILTAVTSGGGKLDMSTWHRCETTHCRAGWAITLAGEAGAKLEEQYGPQRAGTLIYRASTGRVPHFFASDERAMEDIKREAQAAQEAQPQVLSFAERGLI